MDQASSRHRARGVPPLIRRPTSAGAQVFDEGRQGLSEGAALGGVRRLRSVVKRGGASYTGTANYSRKHEAPGAAGGGGVSLGVEGVGDVVPRLYGTFPLRALHGREPADHTPGPGSHREGPLTRSGGMSLPPAELA